MTDGLPPYLMKPPAYIKEGSIYLPKRPAIQLPSEKRGTFPMPFFMPAVSYAAMTATFQDSGTNTNNLTTYTFNSLSTTTTPGAGQRRYLIGCGFSRDSAAETLDSATITGSSATVAGSIQNHWSGSQDACAGIFYRRDDASTSSQMQITHSGAMGDAAVCYYALITDDADIVVEDSDGLAGSGTSMSVTASTGASVICIQCDSLGSGAEITGDVTNPEDLDASVGNMFIAATHLNVSSGGTVSATISASGTAYAAVLVSFHYA